MQPMGIMQLLNIILFWLFFGLLASHFAKKRGRHPLGWFFIGLFLGVIGLLFLFLLPKAEKKHAGSSQKSMRSLPVKQSEAWLKMWYYLDPAHTQQGPFEFPDLIKKWRERAISDKSYVWGEGMQEWKKLSDLPDVRKEFDQV